MKEVWVRADGKEPWDERKEKVTSALECGADAVWVNAGEESSVRRLGKIRVISEGNAADIKVGRDVYYRVIERKGDEQAISKAGHSHAYVAVKTSNWKVIPLENLIASLQGKSRIIVEVSDAEAAKVALETMEVGADGVLVDADRGVINRVKSAADDRNRERFPLVAAKVTAVKSVGMGDRVCVDTASIFTLGEGMLVGSQSSALFLVHSETLKTEYVAARPFRVNAGAVHAYVRLAGGKTEYLSELKAGDDVLAVNAKGESRIMVVGRCKIERRPLLLVEAEYEGKKISTLLQNAETICLVGEEGKAISVSAIKTGDKVLVHIEEVGRHFGMKIKETIKEK
ncbi:3-dehydroquinate synthase [uncultured archaeon]|nr:3-dehydroquinate synthase [uncultured archaeon]